MLFLMAAFAIAANGQAKIHSGINAKPNSGFYEYLPRECRGKKSDEIVEVPMKPFLYCSQASFVNADKELNRVYAKVLAFMRKKGAYDQSWCTGEDEELGGRCPSYEAALVKSQKAWLTMRDLNSRISSYADEGGGEVASLDYYISQADETADRIKFLNGLLASFTEPNPTG